MTTLLSLDTSTTRTGWSVFIDGFFYQSGAIDCSKSDKNEKLNDMIAMVTMELNTWEPDIVVVEQMNVSRNMLATRKLCELVGAVRAWTIWHDSFFYEMAPSEWRKAIGISTSGGKRDEYKELSKSYVKEYIIDRDITDDEADAICIGTGYIKLFADADSD